MDFTTKLVEQLEVAADALPNSLADDEAMRTRAIKAARDVLMKAEQPAEMAHRIAWSPLLAVVAHIACNLRIFQAIDQKRQGITLDDLVLETKADRNLLQRIMRYLTSHEMVIEVGKDVYAPNKITTTLATPGNIGQLSSTVAVCIPAWGAFPSFLDETGYRNPADPKNCPFQKGLNTPDTFFGWLTKKPELLSKFNDYMALPRPQWKSSLAQFFPSERIFKDSKKDEILFVDVGGGIGHQCRDLRTTYPKDKGRIILQDLPQVLDGLSLKDIEVMPHDFMKPQPIIGARAYYFRTVCHDHPDHVCSVFLGQIVAAMREKSVLLIDDLVVPAFGASDYTTAIDIGMMALFASMERSEKQWKDLLEPLGLKIVGLHEYGPQDRHIVEAVLA